jgi:hypothetical protein
MLLLLYLRGKSPQYPFDKRLGAEKPVWTLWRRENPHSLAGSRESNPGRPDLSPSLYQLSWLGHYQLFKK